MNETKKRTPTKPVDVVLGDLARNVPTAKAAKNTCVHVYCAPRA